MSPMNRPRSSLTRIARMLHNVYHACRLAKSLRNMTPKKKALIAITQSNFGGAQKYVYDLANDLPKDTFEVAVVCAAGGILTEKLRVSGIRTIELGSLKRNVSFGSDVRTFFKLCNVLRKERPDVLHTNSSKMGGLGALAGRLMGIKHIIFTAHGWEFNAPRSAAQKTIIRFFSKLIVRLSHKTIAVSETLKRQIGDSAALQGRIVVIPNGVASISFLNRTIARETLADRAHISVDNSVWIGTVAELHPVKGLRYGIEAVEHVLKQSPDTHYFIIGGGTEEAVLQKLIKERGLSAHVHLVGFIDNAAKILSAFDIFLLPSLSEGLAYVLLEAGSAKLPVVASRVGGIPEVIEHNVNGFLVNAKDAPGFADSLLYLIHNKNTRERLGEQLFMRIQEHFSLSKMVEKIIRLYS